MSVTYIRRLDGRKPPRGASWGAAFETSKPRHSRGGRPPGGNRGSGGNRSSRPKKKYQEMEIDLRKLINKAKPTEESAPFVPDLTFGALPIDEKLKENIATKGYVLPTPIQDKAIPQVLMGKDVVGLANTGTGKTA